MRLLDAAFEQRDATFTLKDPAISVWRDWFGGGTSASGISVTEAKVEGIPVVWACITLIADVIGHMPIKLMQRTSGGKEPATNHALYALLHDLPNPMMTAHEFKTTMQRSLCAWGNAYAYIDRYPSGEIKALWPLLPEQMHVEFNTATGKLVYTYGSSGEQQEWTFDSRRPPIFHLRCHTKDGIHGRSPITVVREAFGDAIAAQQYSGAFWANSAIPAGLLIYPNRLKPTAKQNIRESWNERFKTPGKSHGIGVLEEGVKYQQLTIPPEDSQFLQTRVFHVEDLARVFRVPPFLVNLTEKSTCLPGDALIFTEFGPKPICDVEVGEKVWSFDEVAKGFTLSPVFRQAQTGIDQVLTIKTRTRTLRCNAQHRIFVRRKFPDPQPGKWNKVRWGNVWIEAGEAVVGDQLIQLNGLPAQENRQIPTREATVPFMEVCGLLLGDGGVVRTESASYLTFARHLQAPYMDHYRDAMRESFWRCAAGSYGKADKRQTAPITLREYERSTTFSSIFAAEEMIALGMKGTAHTKRVPGWVFGLAPDLQLGFLRGYLDSDGAVNDDGWITYSSVNKALLEDVRHLCLGLGVPVGEVYSYKTGGTGLLNGRELQRARTMYQLCCYSTEGNQRIGSNHPRKQARLDAKPLSARCNWFDPGFMGRGCGAARPGTGFDLVGCVFQPIKTIERSAIAEPVYDLGVEGTHSFIADGVVVHNSWGTGLAQQAQGFITFTMLPWMNLWSQAIARDLLTYKSFETHEAVFIPQSLVKGDLDGRTQAYEREIKIGMLSPNEARELEDMNPREGGDEYVDVQAVNQGGLAPSVNLPTWEPEPEPESFGCTCSISCLCQDGLHEWCPKDCETCSSDCACQRHEKDLTRDAKLDALQRDVEALRMRPAVVVENQPPSVTVQASESVGSRREFERDDKGLVKAFTDTPVRDSRESVA